MLLEQILNESFYRAGGTTEQKNKENYVAWDSEF